MILRGRVWKYGDDVNTDLIFPGKYTYTMTDPQEQARHALEDLDPAFAREVQPGDIVVGGRNFGNGSSREQAVGVFKQNGVRAIVAKSFARIYFRNAVNNGLLPVVCPAAVEAVETGQVIEIDAGAHRVRTRAGEFAFPPLSASLLGIIEAGGLIPMLRKRFGAEHLPMPDVKGGD